MTSANGQDQAGFLQRTRQTVRELLPSRANVSELIGRFSLAKTQLSLFKSRTRARTIDETVPDYEFYDHLRRGKAKGYHLGGLFAKRIENIFSSWVLGRGVEVTLQESGEPNEESDPRNVTDGELATFVDENQALLMQTYKDALGLGDQYIIVNPDGSLSVPSPDTVEVERATLDYRQIVAVEVTTRLEEATIVDRYTATERTITIKEDGQETSITFENLIGRIPVVHVAHGRSANETNGHPIHEELLPLYDEYDDTIFKQLDGAKLLGNPIPTFEGMIDINEVRTDNAPAEQETYEDIHGNEVERTSVILDDQAIVFVGEGGTFKFAAPPTGFTEDTARALKTLFLLLLDHTGIPEFIWGNEISSGRSSSEVQLTQWVRDIEARQKANQGWIVELCELWLRMRALTDPRIVVDDLSAKWPPLIEEDEELQLKRIDFAESRTLITAQTALRLLHLVDDPEREVREARAEADARREELFPNGDTALFQQRLNQDMNGETPNDEREPVPA